MKRDIEGAFARWMSNKFRKPLIVRGARQVGKTYSIKKFGKNSFKNYVIFDFERDRSLHPIFTKDLSPEKLLAELEIHGNIRIIPGKTLLCFDEIQECERALLSLRYFYEEMPELHVIAAGSMLEFAIETISFPVGRVSFEWLRPMTFYEFLLARGKDLLAEKLPLFDNHRSVSDTVHQKIIDELKIYFITGGMPEAINRFILTNSFVEVDAVHEEIFQSYLQSLVKYNKKLDVDSLDHLLKTIPKHVGSQIKYTRLDPERRIEKTKSSLQTLEKALLIHIVHSTNASGLPLGASVSPKKMKLLFLDVGLMQHVCGLNHNELLNEKDLSNIYKGAIVEQFIGQELLAAGGTENTRIYYWSRAQKNSSAEIDYLMVKNGEILPVEVKSGPAGRLKSLHLFLEEHPETKQGFVMSPVSFEKQIVDKLVFIPFYTRL